MNHDSPLRSAPSGLDLIVHTLSLEELLDGARDGLRSHVGELQRRFGPELLRRISQQDSTSTADGIVTDVFMRLPSALVGYEHEGKFDAWLWVMARNILRDRQRQRSRQPDQLTSDVELAGTDRPGRTFERADLVQRLAACLAPRQREAWLLNLEGYSDREVAERLGTTSNNVAQLLFRARARIRQEAQALGVTRSDILDSGLGPNVG